MSFQSWPRLPVFSQDFVAVGSQIPVETSDQRRAQKAILRSKFPTLARVPIDRNYYEPLLLNPSPWRQRLSYFYKAQIVWQKVQKKLGYERRYYYRIYDINRPGIRAIRRQAEAYRDKLSDVFDLDYFAQLLPPQDRISLGRDPIIETKRYLLLLGVLLWAGKNR